MDERFYRYIFNVLSLVNTKEAPPDHHSGDYSLMPPRCRSHTLSLIVKQCLMNSVIWSFTLIVGQTKNKSQRKTNRKTKNCITHENTYGIPKFFFCGICFWLCNFGLENHPIASKFQNTSCHIQKKLLATAILSYH